MFWLLAAGFWLGLAEGNTCFYLTFQCLFIDRGLPSWLSAGFSAFSFVFSHIAGHFCYFCRLRYIWVKNGTGDKRQNAELLNSRHRLACLLTFWGARGPSLILSCTQQGKGQAASLLAKSKETKSEKKCFQLCDFYDFPLRTVPKSSARGLGEWVSVCLFL